MPLQTEASAWRTSARPTSHARIGPEAIAADAAAVEHLTAASKRCLDEAQRQSRRLDDNHVGTEHIVLGVLAADRDIAGTLARNGITETVFLAQLSKSPGPALTGTSR